MMNYVVMACIVARQGMASLSGPLTTARFPSGKLPIFSHDYICNGYIGHTYTCHNYTGHSCIGHLGSHRVLPSRIEANQTSSPQQQYHFRGKRNDQTFDAGGGKFMTAQGQMVRQTSLYFGGLASDRRLGLRRRASTSLAPRLGCERGARPRAFAADTGHTCRTNHLSTNIVRHASHSQSHATCCGQPACNT